MTNLEEVLDHVGYLVTKSPTQHVAVLVDSEGADFYKTIFAPMEKLYRIKQTHEFVTIDTLIDAIEHIKSDRISILEEKIIKIKGLLRGNGRCEITTNLCGTDTQMLGSSCPCTPCQIYLLEQE